MPAQHGTSRWLICGQPFVVLVGAQDDWGSLLVACPVELVHHRVLVGIDRQHGKAGDLFSGVRIDPAVPKACNAKRLVGLGGDLPANRLATGVAGLKKVVDHQQTKLAVSPGRSKTGFVCGGFTSGVVGVASDLVVFGPSWDQSKLSQSTCDSARSMASHDQGGMKAGVGLGRKSVGHFDTKARAHCLALNRRGEIGAHGKSNLTQIQNAFALTKASAAFAHQH